MRRIALVVAVLAGLAGGGVAAPPAHAACIFVIVWHDRAYFAAGTPETLPHPGAPVRGAVEPDCADTGGPARPPTPIAARRIAGVPAGVALLARDTVDSSTVHLHHLLRGSAQVFVDGHTRIEGLARNGLPYIGEGQLVRVDARFCKVPGSIGTKIAGRRIVAAGPIVAPPTADDVLGPDWRGGPGILSRAIGGHSWAAYAALALLAAVAALLIARRRSPGPGTG